MLLADEHYNLVYKIFTKINRMDLIDLFRPLYFAMIYLKEGKDSQEFLKAGPELTENILEILDKIENTRKERKSSKS